MKLTIDKLRHLNINYYDACSLNLDSYNIRDADILEQECE